MDSTDLIFKNGTNSAQSRFLLLALAGNDLVERVYCTCQRLDNTWWSGCGSGGGVDRISGYSRLDVEASLGKIPRVAPRFIHQVWVWMLDKAPSYRKRCWVSKCVNHFMKYKLYEMGGGVLTAFGTVLSHFACLNLQKEGRWCAACGVQGTR